MDRVPPERRSEIMSRIRGKNTKPELIVRRLLHRLGYRFRLHQKDLPGQPDVVLRKYKTAIFIHGCFWHGCEKCDRGIRIPKTNTEFWIKKIAENRGRDTDALVKIRNLGWQVIVLWACETADTTKLIATLMTAMPLAKGNHGR